MDDKHLIEIARKAKENAYSPYSKFKVGAALLTKNGKVYTGCNIENSSFGLSICAERVAIFKAISEGEKDFEKIVIVADTTESIRPCGACRQVMSEFGDFEIVMVSKKNEIAKSSVRKLLPFNFNGSFLEIQH
ncbi:MAG: cytidine deaminase [Thermotogaceae bacterium]|nr:cytidine deaminase [Thermotogaceae bacterium]MDN5337212.1 cytidine deaminase [Thermotogaceae bacterium]